MRVEKDSFGEIELPSDCLYGARTARCMKNTDVGSARLSSYPKLVQALAAVKQACARANFETGHLDANRAHMVIEACRQIRSGDYCAHFPVDMLHGGGYIGFNININEVAANLANMGAGAEPGQYEPVCPKGHVNLHQSTADVCATAARLAIIETAQDLFDALVSLEAGFLSLQARYSEVQTIARTCLMDAMPVAVGENFLAWSAFIDRRKAAFKQALDQLHFVNLGGTVIGSGQGAPLDYRERVISILSETCKRTMQPRSNFYDAAQNLDDLANLSAQLRITADGLLKIAGDVRLLASGPNSGLGELILPAVQEGSSFFAGKVNPVVPETMMQVCMQISGHDRAVQMSMQQGELNLNVFEGLALKNILDAISLLRNGIAIFDKKCVTGIEVDVARCKKHLEALSGTAWATAAETTG